MRISENEKSFSIGEEPPLPTYICRRRARPGRLDGDLNRAPWTSVEPVLLQDARGRGTCAERTELRACWTADCLLVAFHCVDSDIWGTLRERDDPIYEEEVVEVFLCPSGDLRHYYELEVSPWNTLFDARIHSPEQDRRTMRVDAQWDCAGIQTAVRAEGTVRSTPPAPGERRSGSFSWSVELAIPFAALTGAAVPSEGALWRANFYRIERAGAPEFCAWSPTLKDPPDFHAPARFGWLRFEGD